MRSNYRISVYKVSGEYLSLDSYCSRTQVERAFYALCFMLNQKPYRRVQLSLVTPYGLETIDTCEVRHV